MDKVFYTTSKEFDVICIAIEHSEEFDDDYKFIVGKIYKCVKNVSVYIGVLSEIKNTSYSIEKYFGAGLYSIVATLSNEEFINSFEILAEYREQRIKEILNG